MLLLTTDCCRHARTWRQQRKLRHFSGKANGQLSVASVHGSGEAAQVDHWIRFIAAKRWRFSKLLSPAMLHLLCRPGAITGDAPLGRRQA